ncbi:FAD/NAD(P)-binding domain-containing protein [Streptomyces sp. NBRC 109706]|uniref:FAD/NAD(P)-binding protein n=1 Tax=Streptomyces sp. NBRC 109706 TaxID=1550035 RepID=UPI00082BBFB4|nr:FAD/NAD(P)-binding protein [Streptomyces sp. NBRC 109706]
MNEVGRAEPEQRLRVCVIGMGPRGLSVLERICANARHEAPPGGVTVHVVDPHPPGAGQVWRVDQSRRLLMNTVASQVSAFTDETVVMEGPLEPGPSLYEWAAGLLEPREDVGLDGELLREARELGPDDYPSRALCGAYYRWVFARIVDKAPRRVRIDVHRQRAVALSDEPGPGPRQRVRLADGRTLEELHAVVLTQGHLPLLPEPEESALAGFAATHRLRYTPPANPADLDPSAVPAGEPVLLRGLGLNFFDHMALLTEGRGGRYRDAGGRLVYEPSGEEPLLHAGSRGGIPYHARGENQKGAYGRHEPLLLTAERALKLRAGTAADDVGLNFRETLWPLIATEVELVYYQGLLAERGRLSEVERFRADYAAAPFGTGERDRVLGRYGLAPGDRWDWDALTRPWGARTFAGPEEFHRWLLGYLRADIAEARRGNLASPRKSALDVLRDLRNEIRLAIDHGGVSGDSYERDVDGWYTPLNALLSIGPPVRRVAEMAALIEAGVLRVVGPGLRVTASAATGEFVADSPLVPGSRVRARVLVEARLPVVDLSRTADPLLRQLLESGRCRPYRIPTEAGGSYPTGGLDVTERPYHVVDAGGRPHPRRFALGVPTESVHWVTAAGIRPGVGSVTLTDSDAVARTVLGLATDATADATADGEVAAETDRELTGDCHSRGASAT